MAQDKNFKETMKSFSVKQVLRYLEKDPEKNLNKIIDWIIKYDKNGRYAAPQARAVKAVLDDPDNNWNILIQSLWTDIDRSVLAKLFENFIVNAVIIGGERQFKARETYHCNIPWAILMDPTSACNLKCTGCWAADYGSKLNLTFDELDSIIQQGKDLGVYFDLFSGGEPLVRKKDVIQLCEKHNDCAFLAFTNGTLIDEAFADEMLRVKNFVPAISIEGFEEATDARRGKGTYKAIMRAMEILKERKLPFGISCCYTSENVESIGSEAFFDDMIEKGAKFAWFFTYIPVGKNAVPELMVTPEQRAFMYRQIRQFRETKPLFTLDFWNDGEYAGGCIAGGRRYLHINANGDVEPCAFIHYSNSNIRDVTLIEALQSPLFTQYRLHQPFNDNHLRPCPLLDNPEILVDMVEASGAKSTDLACPEDVHELCAKAEPVAKKWAETADKLWSELPEDRKEAAKRRGREHIAKST